MNPTRLESKERRLTLSSIPFRSPEVKGAFAEWRLQLHGISIDFQDLEFGSLILKNVKLRWVAFSSPEAVSLNDMALGTLQIVYEEGTKSAEL